MKSKFSWLREPAVILMILLFLSSIFMAGCGLVLKATAGHENTLVRNTLAVAVPFLFLRGEASAAEIPPIKGGVATLPEGEAPVGAKGGRNGGGESAAASVSYHHVEEDYFDNALFIGDSRTEGLKLYGRLGTADYFASVGMSVFNLFEKKTSDQNFAEQNLYSLLASKKYDLIYLSLGINEVGYPRDALQKQFDEVVSELRRLQPEARLILIENLAVTKEKAERNTSLSLENIQILNELIRSYVNNETIFSLDPNLLLAGEDGYLRPEVTGDGVHPYAKQYQNLAIWLKDFGLD